MLLAIDAGNSNLTLGVFQMGAEKTHPLFHARLATDRSMTCDQLALQLSAVFSLYGRNAKDCTDAVIGSVVSELTGTLAEAARMLTGRTPLVLSPGVKTGLDIKIDNPAQLGADLISTAVAAKKFCPLPCLIVDLGTATKISAVDTSGRFLGCSITAGIAISLEALAARTSLLPRIHFESPGKTIGTNSVESIQSGTVFGTACMMDGMLARMEKELGQPAACVVATGGLSKDIIVHSSREIIHNADLALIGLREIYRKNRG